jgi:Protein of unknown function (DUF3667)
MGHYKLREDKTCLNCQEIVEQRFCPNCGQENKETKESFHYLFVHTLEDLVHYDSGFWKTIKYLLFSPAKLTLEYLKGKRASYVPPVKLYIFISFITFFLISLLPSTKIETKDAVIFNKNEKKFENDSLTLNNFNSLKEYDSIQNLLPETKKSKGFDRYIERKIIEKSHLFNSTYFLENFIKSIFKNIPKTLFIIMPLFAFVIWLFHNKRKWYYFEHGIFTIHYFSMILLSFTIYSIIEFVLIWLSPTFWTSIINIMTFVLLVWWIFYFYRSHSKMYSERKVISRIKSTFILLINLILISLIWIATIFYLALNVN